jgi:hypothetical protein
MPQKYFDSADELMELSNLCEDFEVANILKAGAGKIYELAQSHGAILKTASKEIDQDDAE